MYACRSKGSRLSTIHPRDWRKNGLASILSYRSRNRRRVGRISEWGTNRRQSEQTDLEDMRHFRFMNEKQRKSNIEGSTKFPDVTTGGSTKLSDVATVSNVTIDVDESVEIDTSVSPGKADLRTVGLLRSWNTPFRICQTVVSHEEVYRLSNDPALLDSMAGKGKRQNVNLSPFCKHVQPRVISFLFRTPRQ